MHTYQTIDIIDLSQECYCYMKIKSFLAKRLSEQQEEINTLQKKVKYYMGKDVENQLLITQLSNELKYLKKKDRTFSLCSEDAFSQDLDDLPQDKNKVVMINEEHDDDQSKEDFKQEICKLTVDKYILFNELNEMVMSIKRCDSDQLNGIIMKNRDFDQGDMPIAGGIHLNVLSAENQLCYITNSDYRINKKGLDKETIEYYDRLVKQTNREFLNYIDKNANKNYKE